MRRADPDDCPHRPPCAGCPAFGRPGPPPEALEALQDLARAAALPDPVVHRAPGLGHRHRARLAVRGRARSPKIGLFEAGSHRIVDTPRCAVHHPRINETVAVLKRAIRDAGVEPYREATHGGALRYVQIVVERETERVQVVLYESLLCLLPTAGPYYVAVCLYRTHFLAMWGAYCVAVEIFTPPVGLRRKKGENRHLGIGA